MYSHVNLLGYSFLKMGRLNFCAFSILVAVFIIGVSTAPSHNDAIKSQSRENENTEAIEINEKEDRSLTYEEEPGSEMENMSAREIVEKIKAVNDGLKTPKKRQPVKLNYPPQAQGGYILDKDILDKIQEIIAAGKLNPLSLTHKYQENNYLNNEERTSRDIRYLYSKFPINFPATNTIEDLQKKSNRDEYYPDQVSMAPLPYITNMPVMVVPLSNNIQKYNPDVSEMYQTRQRPSLPFNIPWPLAPFFPILIKDPLLNFLGGGSWNTLFDVGQSADVCNKHVKSVEKTKKEEESTNHTIKIINFDDLIVSNSQRQDRALKKTNNMVNTKSLENDLENINKVKKIFSTKVTTKKPVKQTYTESEHTKNENSNEDEGDLRFPFGDFTWFGNKKPVAPSPGFFINKLKVKRGGVAIAGPGGVATAGRGGTAIVGPGGLAYTQPGGLAVAGPSARVIALSSDTDLSNLVSRLQAESENNTTEEDGAPNMMITEDTILGSAEDPTNISQTEQVI